MKSKNIKNEHNSYPRCHPALLKSYSANNTFYIRLDPLLFIMNFLYFLASS